ncbi:MAG TPA: HAD family phosphatase [Chloroflexia bacterium]|jgi:putative hydrolase of the HAD superfamily
MAIKAVVFDIGGVLEITPGTGWDGKWEARLGLQPGELPQRLRTPWTGGSIGTVSEEEVEKSTREILGLDQEQLEEFMSDLWDDYLGTLNVELAAYFASLRPRYKTGILSNSFVGAREKEQERYGFGDMCDVIVYSHEVGMKKPDSRIYQLLCERLGVETWEVVFLDDVPQAIEAARQVGIHGIVFKNTAQAIADIEACIGSQEGKA